MKFIVSTLPRSRSAWLATWLDAVHEPFALGVVPGDVGVVDTGVAWCLDRVRGTAPIVVVHRPVEEVAESLARLGLRPDAKMLRRQAALMMQVPNALHVRFDQIDARAEEMWRHVRPEEQYDASRFDRLREMRVERRLETIVIAKEATSWLGLH